LEPLILGPLPRLLLHSSCHNDIVDIIDLRRVQARLGGLPRGEQAAVSLAVAEALGPLAELGEQVVASGDVARLLADARPAIESVSPVALRQLLAEAEAMPVMAAREEPPGNAVFAVDVLACLIYAIKSMIEPEPAPWSGHCVQRACDCLFFADEALDRSGGPARLMQALDAWLDGDAGDQLRRESVSIAVLPAQLRQLNGRG
jgi:hypothetical protein